MAREEAPQQQQQQRRRRYAEELDTQGDSTTLHVGVRRMMLEFWDRQEDRAMSFLNHAEIGARLSQIVIAVLGILLLTHNAPHIGQLTNLEQLTPPANRLELYRITGVVVVVGVAVGAMYSVELILRELQQSIRKSRKQGVEAIARMIPRKPRYD